jgi:hypothetical protein
VLLAQEPDPGLRRQRKHPLQMSPHHPVALAGLVQPFSRVLADRLEHVQPRLGAVVIDRDQRPACEALDRVGHPGPLDAVPVGDLLGGVEGEATREDREAAAVSETTTWPPCATARMRDT